jgi:hypothetical protein
MSNKHFTILPTSIMNKIFDTKQDFDIALKADKELDYFGELVDRFPNISDDFIEKLASERYISLCLIAFYLKNKIHEKDEDITMQTIVCIKEDTKCIYDKLVEARKTKNLQEIPLGICNPSWPLEKENILYKGYIENDNAFAAFTFFNFFDASGLYEEHFEDSIINESLGEEYKHLNYRLKKYFQYVKFFDYLPWAFKLETGWFFERDFDEHGKDLTEDYGLSEIDVDYTKISWVYNF